MVIPNWIITAVQIIVGGLGLVGIGNLVLAWYNKKFPSDKEKAETDKITGDIIRQSLDIKQLINNIEKEVKDRLGNEYDKKIKELKDLFTERELQHRQEIREYEKKLLEALERNRAITEQHTTEMKEAYEKIEQLEKKVYDLSIKKQL